MSAHHRNKSLLVTIAPWLFVLLWSTGFIAAKFTIQHAPPFKLLFLRGLFSCVVFLAIGLLTKLPFPSRKGMWMQFKVGLLLQGAFLGGCFFAISHGMPAGLLALITGLQPVLTAVYVSTSKGTRLSGKKWLGIVLGFVGVFLVLSPQSHGLTFGALGLCGAVMGLLGVTTGTIVQNQVQRDGHILTSTLFQYVALTLSAGVLAMLLETRPVAWSTAFAAGLLWLVVGVSTAAMLLLMFMLQRGEATTVASYFYLVPVCTALMAWGIFGEALTLPKLVGMGVTILGMLLVLKG